MVLHVRALDHVAEAHPGPAVPALELHLPDDVVVRRLGLHLHAGQQHGRIDVLYNNAGFVGAQGPFSDTSVEDYDLTMDVPLIEVLDELPEFEAEVMLEPGAKMSTHVP